MTKVHPKNTASATTSPPPKCNNCSSGCVDTSGCTVLTVWKKSLLFNCDGFTVFDSTGNLVFRVDNYITSGKREIVLMDASGNSLFTIRRKRLTLRDTWLVFEGDGGVNENPTYSVSKEMNLLRRKCIALMAMSGSCKEAISSWKRRNKLAYQIEGSYAQRCCTVYDDNRQPMADIKHKEAAVRGVAFGTDVFRLIVHSEFDLAVAMSLVILLDQMFGSSVSPRSVELNRLLSRKVKAVVQG